MELKLYAPAADVLTLTTDEAGVVKLPESTNPGLYLLTLAKYSEAAPGYFQGSAYDIASHSVSLTWKVAAK